MQQLDSFIDFFPCSFTEIADIHLLYTACILFTSHKFLNVLFLDFWDIFQVI